MRDRLIAFLQDEIWPDIPPELLGKSVTKEEEEEILGYGDCLTYAVAKVANLPLLYVGKDFSQTDLIAA